MGLNTNIEWATHSHNFWEGCKKKSLGCAKCYAFRQLTRWGKNPEVVRRVKGFNAPLKWLSSGKAKPGDTVFVNSLSDFFIAEADDWRNDALCVIEATPELTYIILTKRLEEAIDWLRDTGWDTHFPQNIWLGVSCEDTDTFVQRAPLLKYIDAKVRFISFEPLLEPIELDADIWADIIQPNGQTIIDWAVIGGESDYHKPRECKPEWILQLIDNLKAFDIPVFLKQIGGSRKIDGHWGGNHIDGKTWQEWPVAK